jgi:hypothetical protein
MRTTAGSREFVAQGGEPLGAPRDRENARAFSGERERNRASNAAAGTTDQTKLVAKSEFHGGEDRRGR